MLSAHARTLRHQAERLRSKYISNAEACELRQIAAHLEALSYDDACFLSRQFNEATSLATDQAVRVNEWLKAVIRDRHPNGTKQAGES